MSKSPKTFKLGKHQVLKSHRDPRNLQWFNDICSMLKDGGFVFTDNGYYMKQNGRLVPMMGA